MMPSRNTAITKHLCTGSDIGVNISNKHYNLKRVNKTMFASGVSYLVWGFQKSVNSSDLIDERNILSECEMWGSGRLRKICAIKWISII